MKWLIALSASDGTCSIEPLLTLVNKHINSSPLAMVPLIKSTFHRIHKALCSYKYHLSISEGGEACWQSYQCEIMTGSLQWRWCALGKKSDNFPSVISYGLKEKTEDKRAQCQRVFLSCFILFSRITTAVFVLKSFKRKWTLRFSMLGGWKHRHLLAVVRFALIKSCFCKESFQLC